MSATLLKRTYIGTMRGLRGGAERVGLLAALEGTDSQAGLWVRSLFGIYDSQDLIKLDLPWWTFKAIEEVSAFFERRGPGLRVFEFGAGASTVWLAKRAAEVVSVEHDSDFASSLRPTLERHPNARLSVVGPVPAAGRAEEARSRRAGYTELAFDDYVGAITREAGLFDLIVIDGRSRCACLQAALPKLAPEGIILFDNSNRAEYQAAIEAPGLQVQRLRGLAPALPYPSETSLLRRRD